MGNDNKIKAKPFLKWAGGKSQLINTIDPYFLPYEILETKKIKNYVEPFIGGGALFFYLMSEYKVKKSYISDTNEDLILTYNVIKKRPKELINELFELKSNFPSEYEFQKKRYGDIRKRFNNLKNELDYGKCSKNHVLQAAYLIFLNKTCFNGIYRVNSKGEFNVPMGRYKNPSIYDESNILNISKLIKKTTIVNDSYEASKNHITNGSFVYLDPPYRPITETSFTSYTKSNFNDTNQKQLANFYEKISVDANVLLSNSDPKNKDVNDNFFDELYGNFTIKRVPAKRFVNRDGNNRGPINEILVCNYPIKYEE